MNDVIADKPRPLNAELLEKAKRKKVEENNKFTARLLKFESDVRSIEDEKELYFHFCNAPRDLIYFEQSFIGHITEGSHKFRLKYASSIPTVDRNAPFSRWLEKILSRLIAQTGGEKQMMFSLEDYCDPTDDELANYPYREFIWTPLKQKGSQKDRIIGGYVLLREAQWSDADAALLARTTDLYVHSLAALKGNNKLVKSKGLTKPIAKAAVLLLLAAGFIPVPISALAPVEVIPKDPFVLSAPFDGVVKEIIPERGDSVSAESVLITFDDVHLLNNKNMADQRAAVAMAKYDRITQGAIADYRIKRDIEVSRAEYELASAESEYSNELLEKSRVVTPVDGVAIFSDKQDWEGKPVTAGEAILSVANPDKISFSIDLPVKESIVLEEGARVKVFLDSAPLTPLEAVLTEASYSAEADKLDVLSYSLRAEISEDVGSLPRIGVQGTAQVFGEKALLAYVIFRRPYASLRQLTGW